MGTNIVNVKYEDKAIPKTFSGRSYSYFTDIKLEVGDIIEAPTQYGLKIARVSKIDIPYEEIKDIESCMRIITKKFNKENYLNTSNAA